MYAENIRVLEAEVNVVACIIIFNPLSETKEPFLLLQNSPPKLIVHFLLIISKISFRGSLPFKDFVTIVH